MPDPMIATWVPLVARWRSWPAAVALVVCAGVWTFAASAASALPGPVTFTATGAEQTYVVPGGVGSLQVTAVGAPGAASPTGTIGGNAGGSATGVIGVRPGQVLYVEVGGAGVGTVQAFNGGGSGGGLGGGGGGASDVRTVSCAGACPGTPASLASRLLVAGGAGGGGFEIQAAFGQGGVAGQTGQPGGPPVSPLGGGPGTATAPGAGGLGPLRGQAGSLGVGGNGVIGGGGGGGGFYGGGSGGTDTAISSGGGGGGSSYAAPSVVGASISIAAPGTPPSVTIVPAGLIIATSRLVSGRLSTAYSQTLTAVGGTPPLRWSITSGKLPAGLSLNTGTGAITGTPTALGTSSFTVRVTDSSKPALSVTTSLSITVFPQVQAAVFVTDSAQSAVSSFRLGSNGSPPPVTSISGTATGLNGTAAVAIDNFGRVYVASSGNNEIAQFAYGATGNVAPAAVIGGSATGLLYPVAVAVDSSGRVFVANDTGNTVTIYAPGASGNVAPVATITAGLNQPSALAIDANGDLWVANFADNSLTRYATGSGGNNSLLARVTSSDLSGPDGMTIDSNGNVLVANVYLNSLAAFAPSSNNSVSAQYKITGLHVPHGVDIDANGNIYVANELGATPTAPAAVWEFSPNATGNATPIATISGTNTGLGSPFGLAVAPPLHVRTAKLPTARVGRRYQTRLLALLGTTPYTWKLVKGKLAPGLQLGRNGTVSGRPTRPGSYGFTVRVTDSTRRRHMSATERLTLVVKRR